MQRMDSVIDIPEGYELHTELTETDSILQEVSSDLLLPNGYPFSPSHEALKQAVDESAMTADFIIVTRGNDINRNGSMVQIVADERGEGIKLNHYQNNPVVYFDHGFGFPIPIARSSLPKLYKTKATATATFSQILPEASIFFGLIAEGILNTASVSFLPTKARLFKPKSSRNLSEDETEFRPYMAYDFLTSDLLEWSVVGVPADPEAVRKCLDRGQINGYRLTQRVMEPLQKMAGPKPVQSGPGPEELKRRREAEEAQRQAAEAEKKKILETVCAITKETITQAFEPVKTKVSAVSQRIDGFDSKLKQVTGKV